MSRHKGSLQHLGGERWRVKVFIGRSPTGGQVTRSRSFRAPDRKTAERQALTVTGQLLDEIEGSAVAQGSIAELAHDWLDLKRRQGRSPATLKGYEAHVEAIISRFGRKQVRDLTGRDIDRWYGELIDGGMTPATVMHYHASLRGMLRQAEKWELVDTVATRRASPPTVTRPRITPPTDAQVAELITAAGDSEFGNALRILAGTGMRRGELVGLHWSDIGPVRKIEGDDGSITRLAELTVQRSVLEVPRQGLVVKLPKSRKARTLVVGDDVLDALDAQRQLLERTADAMHATLPADGPVFADLRADPAGRRPRTPTWLSHRWDKLRKAHGITARLHDLRHWNATFLLHSGAKHETVKERLGHSLVSTTTDIYGHPVAEADVAAAGLLSQRLGRSS